MTLRIGPEDRGGGTGFGAWVARSGGIGYDLPPHDLFPRKVNLMTTRSSSGRAALRLAAAAVALTVLMLVAGLTPAAATYPGNNGKIAFTNGKGDLAQIWTMGPNGTNKTRITEPPRDNFSPSWNHTGERMVFNTIPPSGVIQIYAMHHNGTLRTQVTTGNRDFLYPAINHDGTKIVASGVLGNGNANLFMMDANGTHIERFTQLEGSNDVEASFSPDGSKVLWERDRPNGDSDIMVKPSAGGPTTQLDGGNQRALSPGFSPDGTHVVFSHEVGNKGTANIKTMLSTGGGQVALTNVAKGTFLTNPAWSPNNLRIAYMRLKDTNQPSDIYVMDANGSNKERLTDGQYLVLDLDWGREIV